MRYSNEQGFSLLEGMLAAVLLGTGLLAMSAMQGIAFVKNVDSSELTRITTLASDMMERIQFNRRNAISYNGINTQSATNCNTISATTQPQARGDCLLWDTLVDGTQLQNIQGTVTVSNIIAPIALGQRNVTVTITWVGSLKSDSTVKRARSLTINRVIAPE
jgi:type IV pilus assembly protein PilV